MGEFKQIQEILSKIGTEFFKIDEEMTEKNEAEDGNSISLKSSGTWNETDRNSSHFFLLLKLEVIYIFYTSLIHRKYAPSL